MGHISSGSRQVLVLTDLMTHISKSWGIFPVASDKSVTLGCTDGPSSGESDYNDTARYYNALMSLSEMYVDLNIFY